MSQLKYFKQRKFWISVKVKYYFFNKCDFVYFLLQYPFIVLRYGFKVIFEV